MNFLKRAFLSVFGHKSRTIIIFLAFTVIASMLLSAFAISSASKSVKQSVNKQLCSQIKIKHKDIEFTVSGTKQKLACFVENDFESQLKGIKHITLVNHSVTYSIDAGSFKVTGDETLKSSHAPMDITQAIVFRTATDTSKLTEFLQGDYKLIKGRHLNKNDEGKNNVIINEKVAKENNLKISDKITVYRYDNNQKRIKCAYTIIGIFSAPIADIDKNSTYRYASPEKLFFTSMNSNLTKGYTNKMLEKYYDDFNNYFKGILEKNKNKKYDGLDFSDQQDVILATGALKMDSEGMRYMPKTLDDLKRANYLIVTVDDPNNVNKVISNLKKLKDGDQYNFQTNTELYNRITVPLSAAEKLSSVFVYIIFGAGLLIMALIVMLSLRGREHEFGVMISIGEKKFKILLQVLFETLIPVLCSLIVSIFASGLIAQKAGNAILQKNYNAVNASANILTQSSYEMSNTEFNDKNIEQINKIDINVTPQDTAAILGLSLIIVVLSASVPMVKILRLSPMKVLSKKQ